MPAQTGVYGEPMTSGGLPLGQEASLLGGLISWRDSMVGTMEWRDCTTLDTSSQFTCHALDAVAPVLIFIITGGNSSVAGETAKIAFDPNHEFRK
ncbi:hypothetical protein [Corynebacterium sp. A21]|uniref:hypothetical protein n=1 Tax=Corynebacterium sp. A21 TaxID=3457318 RepID=UPI003FD08B8D